MVGRGWRDGGVGGGGMVGEGWKEVKSIGEEWNGLGYEQRGVG